MNAIAALPMMRRNARPSAANRKMPRRVLSLAVVASCMSGPATDTRPRGVTGDSRQANKSSSATQRRLVGRNQRHPSALHAERDATLLQCQRILAKDFAPPAVQGGDLRRILSRQAVDVIRA